MPSFRFPQFTIKRTEKYEAISSEGDGISEYSDESGDPLTPTLAPAPKRHPSYPLYVVTIIFGALAAFFFARTVSLQKRGTFHNGFSSELGQ